MHVACKSRWPRSVYTHIVYTNPVLVHVASKCSSGTTRVVFMVIRRFYFCAPCSAGAVCKPPRQYASHPASMQAIPPSMQAIRQSRQAARQRSPPARIRKLLRQRRVSPPSCNATWNQHAIQQHRNGQRLFCCRHLSCRVWSLILHTDRVHCLYVTTRIRQPWGGRGVHLAADFPLRHGWGLRVRQGADPQGSYHDRPVAMVIPQSTDVLPGGRKSSQPKTI
jgi:hypothetical protein